MQVVLSSLGQVLRLLALVFVSPVRVCGEFGFDLWLVVVVVGERRVHLSEAQVRTCDSDLLRCLTLLVQTDDVVDANPRVVDGRLAAAAARTLHDVRVGGLGSRFTLKGATTRKTRCCRRVSVMFTNDGSGAIEDLLTP
jgi:hypothetical protein